MSRLLDTLVDAERLAQCHQAEGDQAVAAAREAQRYAAPFWLFGERTAAQLRIQHPRAAKAARPHHSRFWSPVS